MESQSLIDSGNLELYVFGVLEENENIEITSLSLKDDLILEEIISIEESIITLSSSFCPTLSINVYELIKKKIESKKNTNYILSPTKDNESKQLFPTYLKWAAVIVLFFSISLYFYENQSHVIENLKLENNALEQSVVEKNIQNTKNQEIIALFQNPDYSEIALQSQKIAPSASAKVYWNKQNHELVVDASKLPNAPKGMVYQLWALKLNPLTPTSIGLLVDKNEINSKIYKSFSATDAEAFGITLEPEGGSKSPTLEQLYALGKV